VLENMPSDTAEVEAKSRSDAVPKGKTRLLRLDDIDRRTAAYRETAELISALEADLGGRDQVSTARLQIVESAGVASAMRKDLAARWLSGEPVDVAAYCTLANAERRLYETVGLDPRPRDVTPSVAAYVAHVERGE
jgi:hypothetical protein